MNNVNKINERNKRNKVKEKEKGNIQEKYKRSQIAFFYYRYS